MTDNEITREKTFSEELPYFKERIKEVFDNYDNPNGYEDPLYIAVLRDSKRIVRKAEEEITCQQTEIERLKEFIVETRRCDKEIKSEAVKDFAERLKNEIINDTAYACDSTQHSGYYDYQIKIGDIPEYIDNLVKEMIGDDNA